MNFDLRKLRHMSVLAKEGHFSRAAEKLHITQSALTRSIQTLETELDIRIFDRAHTGVTLTPVGRLLLEKAETLLRDANGIQREIELIKEYKLGSIRFGMGPMVTSVFLTELLTTCTREYPALQIWVETHGPEVLSQMLLDEKIEFFIGSNTQIPSKEAFSLAPFGNLELGCFVRPEHPLSRKAAVTDQDIRRYPMGIANSSSLISDSMHRQFVRFFKLEPHERSIATIMCNADSVLVSVALSSDLIFFTSRAALQNTDSGQKMVELRTPPPRMHAELVIVTLAGRTPSPAAKLLRDMLTMQMRRIGSTRK